MVAFKPLRFNSSSAGNRCGSRGIERIRRGRKRAFEVRAELIRIAPNRERILKKYRPRCDSRHVDRADPKSALWNKNGLVRECVSVTILDLSRRLWEACNSDAGKQKNRNGHHILGGLRRARFSRSKQTRGDVVCIFAALLGAPWPLPATAGFGNYSFVRNCL